MQEKTYARGINSVPHWMLASLIEHSRSIIFSFSKGKLTTRVIFETPTYYPAPSPVLVPSPTLLGPRKAIGSHILEYHLKPNLTQISSMQALMWILGINIINQWSIIINHSNNHAQLICGSEERNQKSAQFRYEHLPCTKVCITSLPYNIEGNIKN